jgi:carbon-monoxide dehydrogenase small subunit
MERKKISFMLNGTLQELHIQPWRTLLEIIREDLQLTGTKEGCGEGECGSCTVMLGDKTVNSCLVPAAEYAGMQCGFCTPGMIMSAKELLESNPSPNEEEIREGIAGNFCRCTGYTKIIESISAAAEVMQGGE